MRVLGTLRRTVVSVGWRHGGAAARGFSALALLTLLLAACAGPPAPSSPEAEIEPSRVYEGTSRDAAFERTLAALRDAGLRVAGADESQGVISAGLSELGDRGWAVCPERYVSPRDDTRRRRRAESLGRDLELTASVREAPNGVAVSLDATVVERLRNSFTNLTFTQRCRSTGALEGEILQEVERGVSGARPSA